MNTKNLKPFDLEAALKGEPVMLRNGQKAFVRHHETELSTKIDQILLGYIEEYSLWAWCEDGASSGHGCESPHDIIGMYPETRIINGFEVPVPVREEPRIGGCYFKTDIYAEEFYDEDRWSGCSYDLLELNRGLVFLTKEDAIANAKAMLGINPYEESE